MEPQSIITYPSGGQRVQPGFHEIRGLAWSGFGRIAKVEVSFDEGRTWRKAVLEPPVEPYAFVRFKLPWYWDGKEVVLWSRAWDEKGNTQPTREEFFRRWSRNNRYHYNAIQAWRILPDGRVVNGDRPLGQGAFGPVGPVGGGGGGVLGV